MIPNKYRRRLIKSLLLYEVIVSALDISYIHARDISVVLCCSFIQYVYYVFVYYEQYLPTWLRLTGAVFGPLVTVIHGANPLVIEVESVAGLCRQNAIATVKR